MVKRVPFLPVQRRRSTFARQSVEEANMKCTCKSTTHGHKDGECKKEAAKGGVCPECSAAERKAKR